MMGAGEMSNKILLWWVILMFSINAVILCWAYPDPVTLAIINVGYFASLIYIIRTEEKK
jgi:hypothetical protein